MIKLEDEAYNKEDLDRRVKPTEFFYYQTFVYLFHGIVFTFVNVCVDVYYL